MNQRLLKPCVAEFVGTLGLIFDGVCAILVGSLAAGVVYGGFLIKDSR